MTEEQKAKRREYMKNYYKNLSRYQKEKRKEENRRSYLKNIDRIKAYAKAYRQKQKEKCLQNEKEKN
jgi:hypothetical protein